MICQKILGQKWHKFWRNFFSKPYYKPVLWSSSYCVISAGGAPLEVIKKYIRNQKTPQ
ncbi:hypothetical protein CWATWH8502_749 [Crocosphaera watsonii WH 8502]|uniref:Transposase IS200-like domain-containing protein n=1 Tax=Crocosphaera watsonii WH 8502 TaxID=423474 RepID=T2I6Y6_CROWT|nr:hypothetical protein CWATWH8502_749 [Crocosphaera watsonii WH 8502]